LEHPTKIITRKPFFKFLIVNVFMDKFSAQIKTAYLGLAMDICGEQLLCQKSPFDKLLEDLSSIHSST